MNSGGKPAPCVADVELDAARLRLRPDPHLAPPWRSALSTRLVSACSSRSRSPSIASPASPSTTSGPPGLGGAGLEALGDRRSAGRRPGAARGRAPAGRPRSGRRPAGPRRAGPGGRPPRAPEAIAARSSSSDSPCRSASSSSVLCSASGVRSSWLASSTKRRSRSSVASIRAEHLVQGQAEPLQLVVGRRDRQPLVRSARPRSPPRAGASPRPGAAPPPRRVADQRGEEQRDRAADQEQRRRGCRARRCGRRARSRPTTISSPDGVSIGAASRRAVVSIPGRPARSKKVGDGRRPAPARDRRRAPAGRRSCGVESTIRPLGVRTWAKLSSRSISDASCDRPEVAFRARGRGPTTSPARERSPLSIDSSSLRFQAEVEEEADRDQDQRHRRREGERHPQADRDPAHRPPSRRSR